MTDKPVLTKELENNMIRECSIGFDINKLDISELINTVLLLDIQNREYCIINPYSVKHNVKFWYKIKYFISLTSSY